jgi:hypothetical protein
MFVLPNRTTTGKFQEQTKLITTARQQRIRQKLAQKKDASDSIISTVRFKFGPTNRTKRLNQPQPSPQLLLYESWNGYNVGEYIYY